MSKKRKRSVPVQPKADRTAKAPLGAPFFLFNIVMGNVTYYNIGGGGL